MTARDAHFIWTAARAVCSHLLLTFGELNLAWDVHIVASGGIDAPAGAGWRTGK
ncbi:hypothetical protein LMG29739_02267 [Paraburkholderia solisilvae]|uniref:Uncharacterized protein n=1 Tax=Paraburkholderia solisilvae TaxID=624376 RepID=A0A6J5DS44_9BURK|nr:hypothetical protein LMG29739_02267 [Paraburkholderia solisilvae]